MTDTKVRIIGVPHIDPARGRVDITLPVGASIADLIATGLPGLPPERYGSVRAMVGDIVVPQDAWKTTKPKAGKVVVFRAVPGKEALPTAIVLVAALAGQFYVGPLVASTLGFTAGTTAFSVASAASSLAFTAGAALLTRALIPPPAGLGAGGQGGNDSPTYSIQGWQNVAAPGMPIPAICGTHRFAPPYWARPYTTIIGDDQYTTSLFCLGFGPVSWTDEKIGETPLSQFTDVAIERRYGYASDLPVSIYPEQVLQDNLSAQVTSAGADVIRTTAKDAERAAVDLFFDRGLFRLDEDGNYQDTTVIVQIKQRRAGTDDAFEVVDNFEVTAKKASQIYRTYEWTLPQRGQWDIALRRVTADRDTGSEFVDSTQWSALRSIRPEHPVNFDRPLAFIAIRVKATNQLNGILDQFNCIVSRLIPDYDTATGTWMTRATSNPASIFRDMWQGSASKRPKTDAEMDLDEIEAWHTYCAEKGLTYNYVHDSEASFRDAVMNCAAAGRASVRDTGEKIGVFVDRPQSVITGALTPRNTWGFKFERSNTQWPDAYRVKFIDAENSYQESERIVPWPGFVGEPQVITNLDLPGYTTADLVWRGARWRQYGLLKRPDTFTVSQDIKSLVSTRGDLVLLNHDALDRAQVAARVVAINDQTVLLDTPVTMTEGMVYGCKFIYEAEQGTRSIFRRVTSFAEETKALSLSGDLSDLGAGDLCLFGKFISVAEEVIVKQIQSGDNLSATITAVAHAPEIEALVDSETPPPFSPRVGAIADLSDVAPPLPTITDISATATGTGDQVRTFIGVSPGTEGAIATSYEARHRLQHTLPWLDAISPAGSGGVSFTDYDGGDLIETQVRALSRFGASSSWTALERAGPLAAPSPPTAFSAAQSGGDVIAAWTNPDHVLYKKARLLRGQSVDNSNFGMAYSPELRMLCVVAYSGTGNRVKISTDGKFWETISTPADNQWLAVCWSSAKSLWVAVGQTGTGNRVMTSPDGRNWTIRASAADNNWTSVCWADALGLFVAVSNNGTGNRVMTSPDGITWTARSSAADNAWTSVCWAAGLGLLVAVASSGTGDRVMTSSNGTTWTTQTSAGDYGWHSVCWSPDLGLLCAVATDGGSTHVMTSSTATGWTLRNSAADIQWFCVCWAAYLGLFVAVAVSGTGNRVMTSPDGITWTLRTSAADNTWLSVCSADELGIVCAASNDGAGNRFMTAEEAVTWISGGAPVISEMTDATGALTGARAGAQTGTDTAPPAGTYWYTAVAESIESFRSLPADPKLVTVT